MNTSRSNVIIASVICTRSIYLQFVSSLIAHGRISLRHEHRGRWLSRESWPRVGFQGLLLTVFDFHYLKRRQLTSLFAMFLLTHKRIEINSWKRNVRSLITLYFDNFIIVSLIFQLYEHSEWKYWYFLAHIYMHCDNRNSTGMQQSYIYTYLSLCVFYIT